MAIFCGYMIREVDQDPMFLASSKWWTCCGNEDYIRQHWYEYLDDRTLINK